MTKITVKNVLAQLKADLIGKDSHRGVTLTYSWLANQFGHFSLGFIPTLLLYPCLTFDSAKSNWAALFVGLFWLCFELYNFLGPLLGRSKSASKVLYIPSKNTFQFEPAWKNIAFDTFTDLCFFWIGTWCAAYFIQQNTVAIICLISFIGIAAYPIYFWFLTKMYLQNAAYPVQYRLSQWNLGISAEGKETVLDFMKTEKSGKHLLLCGAQGRGKTSLSIGMATELSIQRKTGNYLTATKLLTYFKEDNQKPSYLWDYKDAQVVVVDDICPGPPMDHLISPTLFPQYMEIGSHSRAEKEAILKEKNVIWVLGEETENSTHIQQWKAYFRSIGVPSENVYCVYL